MNFPDVLCWRVLINLSIYPSLGQARHLLSTPWIFGNKSKFGKKETMEIYQTLVPELKVIL
jgi:hypothetical protein